MLESMFGDGPEVDPEELDLEVVKEMQVEAHKAEEEAAKKAGRPVVTDKKLHAIKASDCS